MRYEALRRKLEELKAMVSKHIILRRKDGSVLLLYKGKPLDFAMDSMRPGKVSKACLEAASAEGCAHMHEIGAAFAAGPVKLQKGR